MGLLLPVGFLKTQAFILLEGVGDASLGQWEEYTGYAFHLRRRLSSSEQSKVGDAIDTRGTPEQEKRWMRIRQSVSVKYRHLISKD